MSRHFWARHDSDRIGVPNDRTVVMPVLGDRLFTSGGRAPAPPCSFEDAFRRVHSQIRDTLRQRAEPGLALFIVGESGLEASAWTGITVGEFESVIVGRHNHTDLFLPTDRLLSLRHIAVVLYPPRPGRGVRYRVVDLRSGVAFSDEHGRRLESVEADGPLMLRSASFAMLVFPTDETGASWPDDPDEAWARVPPREFVEAQDVPPDRAFPWVGSHPPLRVERGAWRDQSTTATTFPGPVLPRRALQVGETACGELRVSSQTGAVALRAGRHGLRRGLLLGRYDRCDTRGLPVLSHNSLSRVHLLVVELDGELLAVDTGSTNGTWVEGRRTRCARLDPGRRLLLAGIADVEWRFLH